LRRLAVERFAVERFAGARLAVERFAVERFAGARLAVDRFAVELLAVERFAVERFAVERFAVERFAVERFAVERLAVERFADVRFAVDPRLAAVRLRGVVDPPSCFPSPSSLPRTFFATPTAAGIATPAIAAPAATFCVVDIPSFSSSLETSSSSCSPRLLMN
jgi:hypothetical protein